PAGRQPLRRLYARLSQRRARRSSQTDRPEQRINHAVHHLPHHRSCLHPALAAAALHGPRSLDAVGRARAARPGHPLRHHWHHRPSLAVSRLAARRRPHLCRRHHRPHLPAHRPPSAGPWPQRATAAPVTRAVRPNLQSCVLLLARKPETGTLFAYLTGATRACGKPAMDSARCGALPVIASPARQSTCGNSYKQRTHGVTPAQVASPRSLVSWPKASLVPSAPSAPRTDKPELSPLAHYPYTP